MPFVASRCLPSALSHRLLWATWLWLIGGAISVSAAINTQNYQSAGPVAVSINGADCGRVYSFAGGDLVGDVIIETPVGSVAPQKHLGARHYAPLVMELNIPPGAALADWISDLCAGRNSPKTVVLTETDFNGHVTAVSQFNNAVLSEVSFPDLNVSAPGLTAYVKVLIAVSDRQALATNSVPTPSFTGTSTANNAHTDSFSLQLGTLPPNASRIAGFTLKRGAGGGVTTSAVPALPNLILTFNTALVTEWKAWCTDFVVNGNSSGSAEKNGSLIFEAADQHPVFTLQLGHVGIIRATPNKISAAAETIHTTEVELYFETASASSSPAASDPVGPATTTTPAPSPSTSATPTPARLATKEATAGALFAKKETVLPASVHPVANDQGGQDPKDFPRPPNLVRKSYLSFAQKDTRQEMATYSATDRPEVLDEFYNQQLKAAGWTSQSHFDTTGSNNARQFMGMWKTETRNAMVSMTQADDGVTVTISVSTPVAP